MRAFLLLFSTSILFVISGCVTGPATSGTEIAQKTAALFEVGRFDDQVTGVAVSREGRVFVNFPRWGRNPRYSVAELLRDGSVKPYPDESWNSWKESLASHPEARFICVQSVYADRGGYLWILDPASPSFTGVVPGGAKLLKVRLADDVVERVYRFDDRAAPKAAYLNDVRLDPSGRFAYITDSGLGAIVVLDLDSGASRRVLVSDPSTKADAGLVPVIEGRELRDSMGKVPQIHSDGIAMDPRGEFLYYHALTAKELYRVRTSDLADSSLSEAELGRRVERLGETGPVDGMEMDRIGILYFTALEENAVKYRRTDGTTGIVAKDDHLQWPDSLSIGPDDYLYITASQINRMPRFNGGTDRHVPPYLLFRIWLTPL